ncbi:uncharacterized protein LOC110826353 isoform X2 [Carica papaya]|uniref:uncharacterized protein LOC110826353 isoform X2 n=1 Tax=Carica papaya TaxID=3649 RepID=UPI000B8C71BE|nr:uncharacterized protein LOC110826353 isoform X2 [Carica papaya]
MSSYENVIVGKLRLKGKALEVKTDGIKKKKKKHRHHHSPLSTDKEWVSGLPAIQVPDQLYEHCVLRKKHIDPFPTKQALRAKSPLELVHSGLCYMDAPYNRDCDPIVFEEASNDD